MSEERYPNLAKKMADPDWRPEQPGPRVPWPQEDGFWADGETCQRCDAQVGPHVDSWWRAPDALWDRVVAGRYNILCPPCFSALARGIGLPVWWEPKVDATKELPTSVEVF